MSLASCWESSLSSSLAPNVWGFKLLNDYWFSFSKIFFHNDKNVFVLSWGYARHSIELSPCWNFRASQAALVLIRAFRGKFLGTYFRPLAWIRNLAALSPPKWVVRVILNSLLCSWVRPSGVWAVLAPSGPPELGDLSNSSCSWAGWDSAFLGGWLLVPLPKL